MLEKNEGVECPIPLEWRSVIVDIVDSIRQKQPLGRSALGYQVIPEHGAIEWIYKSLNAYGGTLKELPEEAWRTSICIWMGSSWELLVDLFTEEEEKSDLVLFIDVFEAEGSLIFKVKSAYVP